MRIALLLSTAFVSTLPEAPDRERRIRQYVAGFQQIASLRARYPVFDIFSVDNTVPDDSQIDRRLSESLDAIPALTAKCHFDDNEVGRINKGSGLVVQWARVLPELIGRYEYVVHYEPRQKLVNESFFERMAAAPAAYMCFYRDQVKFYGVIPLTLPRAWTGLFSIKTVDLLAYVNSPDRGVPAHISYYKKGRLMRSIRARVLPGWFAEIEQCIESDLPKYLRNHAIEIMPVPELGAAWHQEVTGNWIEMKERLFEH